MGALASLINITPEAQELIDFATTFLATVQAVRITSPEDLQGAADHTRKIQECAKALEETRKGYTVPLDDQKKAYMDYFRPAVEVLDQAEKVLKAEIGRYTAEQARLAAEEEKRRRIAEAEERRRQEEEQAAAAQLLAEAEAAAASGDYAKAEALEEQAAAAQVAAEPILIPATVAPANAKAKGTSVRTIWKCKVVDPSKLDRAYLMPNQVVLDALAASAKGVGAAPAGCEWTSSDSVSIR